MSLAAALREATRERHQRTEGHPFIQHLFAGRLRAADYARMLASLQPVYRALEDRLEAAAPDAAPGRAAVPGLPPGFSPELTRQLARAPALEHDLRELAAHGHTPAAPGPAALALAARVRMATPQAWLAHAYVRYLGDLSGGQMMRGLLVPMLGEALASTAGQFHDFGDPAQVRALTQALRVAIDRAGLAQPGWCEAVVAEACLAFDLHLRVFDEVGG